MVSVSPCRLTDNRNAVSFTRWSEVFLDPTAAAAVIDRVVHHATVLQTTGGSFRLAAAKQNQAPAAGKKGAR